MILSRILRALFTAGVSILLTGLSGIFYIAKDHVMRLNILVWFTVVGIAYFILYGICLLIHLIFKRKKSHKPLLFDGYSVAAGFLGILIFNLAIVKNMNDSLYIQFVNGILVGVPALIQLFLDIHKKVNKRKTKRRK